MERRGSTSSGVLANLDNVDVKKLKPSKKPDVSSRYSWHTLGAENTPSLNERKRVTEQRREELLVLLYREDLTTGEIEELIREWVSLVAERDKLLHEEINKENYTERNKYVKELQKMLRDKSLLGNDSEEMNIRVALLALESQLTNYCQSHDITSPPRPCNGTQLKNKVEVKPTKENPKIKKSQREDMLDHDTGQTGVLCSNHSSFESSTPKQNSPNAKRDASCRTNGVMKLLPPLHKPSPVVIVTQPPNSPPTPRPPTPPPLPININQMLVGKGTLGTVQFSGNRSNNSEIANSSNSSNKTTEAPDPSLEEGPSGHERKNLMEEISLGQSVLRRTTRARSPGGTPIKATKNRLTLTGNTDMLQRALISKFRSLHSTPIQNGAVDQDQLGESFDFSNTWSDINNSVAYDDPDLTTTSSSGFASAGSLAGTPGYSQNTGKTNAAAVGHDTSTAV